MTEENDKGAGDGNHPLGASNQEEVKVDNIFPQHLAMLPYRGFASDFDHQPLLSPIIGIITHYHHHQ